MANFTRRNFLQHSALLAFLLPSLAAKATSLALQPVNQWQLSAEGWVPNNPILPALQFRMPQPGPVAQAQLMTGLMQAGWTQQWQGKPFAYQHFHSSTHVIFVVAAGSGQLQIGGDNGVVVPAAAGDLIFLPAGTGQRLLHSSDDFSVLACYPNGQNWDVCRSAINAETLKKVSSQKLGNRTRRFFNHSGTVI